MWERLIRRGSRWLPRGSRPPRLTLSLTPPHHHPGRLQLLVCLYEIFKTRAPFTPRLFWHWGARRRGEKKRETKKNIHTNIANWLTDWHKTKRNLFKINSPDFSVVKKKTSDALFIHMSLARTLCSFTHSWRLAGTESHPRQASGSDIDLGKKQTHLKPDKTPTLAALEVTVRFSAWSPLPLHPPWCVYRSEAGVREIRHLFFLRSALGMGPRQRQGHNLYPLHPRIPTYLPLMTCQLGLWDSPKKKSTLNPSVLQVLTESGAPAWAKASQRLRQ